MQCLVNTVGESELPSQALTLFAWSSKKHVVLHYPDGRLCVFCWLILDAFCRLLLSVGLIGAVLVWINRLAFRKELIIEDSLSIPPYTRHLLWMKTGFWWCWWWLPHDLFRSILSYSIHFSLPVTVCFKNWNVFTV